MMRNMFTVHTLLYFVVVRCRPILPLFLRVPSLIQEVSRDCPCANEVTLNDMGKQIRRNHLELMIYNQTQAHQYCVHIP